MSERASIDPESFDRWLTTEPADEYGDLDDAEFEELHAQWAEASAILKAEFARHRFGDDAHSSCRCGWQAKRRDAAVADYQQHLARAMAGAFALWLRIEGMDG